MVLEEPDSKEARKTLIESIKKGYSLFTVDIALAECLNVIWKHTNLLKDLNVEEAKSAFKDLTKIYSKLTIISTREIAENALNTATTQNTTAYDALYIAAAQKNNAALFTADQKLCTKANQTAKTNLLKPQKE